jgi:hypothetical protein
MMSVTLSLTIMNITALLLLIALVTSRRMVVTGGTYGHIATMAMESEVTARE